MNDNNKDIKEKSFKFRDEYYYNLVKNNIKKCRNFFGYTQDEMAEMINTATKYYSHLEGNRHFPLHVVGHISEVLMIPISTLFIEDMDIPRKHNDIVLHDDDYFYNVVRKNIRRYRKFRGLSQRDLSSKINRGRDYIAEIESGKKKNGFPISTIGRIADVLNIPIERFFDSVE